MKEQVEALLDNLKNHKDITYLDVYEDIEDTFWTYYYHVSGSYKGVYFLIGMNKAKRSEADYKIQSHVTANSREFKAFLSTITNLDFKIK